MSDKKDLLRGFLEYLGSPFLELYRELVNSNRVLFVDEEGIEGEAICLPTLNSYYLCISNYYNHFHLLCRCKNRSKGICFCKKECECKDR